MGALSELSTAGSILRRNPILSAGALIWVLIGHLAVIVAAGGGGAVLTVSIFAVGSLITFLLAPFFLGGNIGMAAEGLSGRPTGLRTLFDEGVDNYLSIFSAGILRGVLIFITVIAYLIIYVIVYGILVLILGAGVVATVPADGGANALPPLSEWAAAELLGLLGLGYVYVILIVSVLGLLFYLILFFVYLSLNFFDVAIVMDDEDALGGIKRSVGFVKCNIVSTSAFLIITVTLGLFATLPLTWLSFWMSFVPNAPLPVALVPISIILLTLFSAFSYAYRVALYDGLTGGTESAEVETPSRNRRSRRTVEETRRSGRTVDRERRGRGTDEETRRSGGTDREEQGRGGTDREEQGSGGTDREEQGSGGTDEEKSDGGGIDDDEHGRS